MGWKAGAILGLLSAFTLIFPHPIPDARGEVVGFREDFNDLANWEPYYFKKIDNHTRYTVEHNGHISSLRAESNASASGILLIKKFSVYDYPIARWRWKIEKVYENGDAASKMGDDYPIRVYMIFRKKVLFGLISLPTSLNYIWANRSHEDKIIPNAYTERSMMIVLQEGGSRSGQWVTEEVNLLDDYRRAFGNAPPETATIAIMNDSDNTRESSVSYIDYIEVLRR